jgi:hypothetical protein
LKWPAHLELVFPGETTAPLFKDRVSISILVLLSLISIAACLALQMPSNIVLSPLYSENKRESAWLSGGLATPPEGVHDAGN